MLAVCVVSVRQVGKSRYWENMFLEDQEWNDEPDAQALSNTVLSITQKSDSTTNIKSRGVGKKSLIRTLQALGSVPDWRSDAPQDGSDSDRDTVPLPPKAKRKKKRSKRGKKPDLSGEDGGNNDLGAQEKKTGFKKTKKNSKSGVSEAMNTDDIIGKSEEITAAVVKSKEAAAKMEGQNTDKLSRKHWKNKMKNKKKCKNKYRSKDTEQESIKAVIPGQHNPDKQQKVNPSSNSNERTFSETPAQQKKTKDKPQKRKHIEKVLPSTKDTKTPREDKQGMISGEKLKRGIDARKSLVQDSKHEAGEQQGAIEDDQQASPSKRMKPELSKEQIFKRQKLRRLLQDHEPDKEENPSEQKDEKEATPAKEDVNEEKVDHSTSLRARMEQRLEAARFRYINEVLYTTSSGEAKRMFQQDPAAFGVYHRGFTNQVQRWPSNPVDVIISFIRQKPPSQVVADFGCGDCKIARSVKNKVHSFDLVPICDLVTVCDMAKVPLKDNTVDIAVFCLSLMGTNLCDFLAEANRVLVMGGTLKIAEVASRFDNLRGFLHALANFGFKLVSKDTGNTHFYTFELVKTGDAPANIKKSRLELKPCVYKKR